MTGGNVLGWESGDTAYGAGIGTTQSVGTTNVRTGTYALQCAPVTTGTGFARISDIAPNGIGAAAEGLNTSQGFVGSAVYVATLPSAAEEILRMDATGGTTRKLALLLNSTGTLTLVDAAGTAIATTTFALSTGVWYYIEIESNNGAAANHNLWVNGSNLITGTSNQGANNCGRGAFGKSVDTNGSGYDVWFDDGYLSDTQLGDIRVYWMDIDGDGTGTGWTASAGNKWETCDEKPHTSDTDYITSSTATDAYTATVESASAAGVPNRTIHAVIGRSVVRDEGGVSGISVRIRSTAGSSDTTSNDPGSTYVSRSNIAINQVGGSPWDYAALDAVEVGVLNNVAVAVRCTQLGVDVAVANPPRQLPLTGVGI